MMLKMPSFRVEIHLKPTHLRSRLKAPHETVHVVHVHDKFHWRHCTCASCAAIIKRYCWRESLNKKSLWCFAHIVRWDQVNIIPRNIDKAARRCTRSVYSIYTCLRSARVGQRFVGFFCFSDADWLGRQTPITWNPFTCNSRTCSF